MYLQTWGRRASPGPGTYNLTCLLRRGTAYIAMFTKGLGMYWSRKTTKTTPALLHTFAPAIPNSCWHCHQAVSTLLHPSWECPVLQLFWSEVYSVISQVMIYTLDYSPAQYLLHHTSLPSKWRMLSKCAYPSTGALSTCLPSQNGSLA